jgi:hypothetical protein
MLKIARRFLPRPVLVAIALWLPRYNRQLDPVELKKAIAATLPPGTSKDQVIKFFRSRRALYCDDLGSKVEAGLLGEALDRLHSWDVDVVFAFDAGQRVLSYSLSECLIFY